MSESPLAGVTVGVTADRCRDRQADLLTRRGARVVLAPTLRTVPVDDEDGLRGVTESVVADPPDVLVVSTGAGVQAWNTLAHASDLGVALGAALEGTTIVARGSKAHDAAVAAGWSVDWTSANGLSSEVVDHLQAIDVAGRRVAVQLDGDEVAYLADAIGDLGAEVVPVSTYRWRTSDETGPVVRLAEAAAEGRIDALTFTSAPAVWGLTDIADKAGHGDGLRAALSGRVLAVCVGPVCAAAAESAGFLNVLQPRRPRLSSMVQALVSTIEETEWSVNLGTAALLIRASTVVVDGEVIDLAPRERDVLSRLARRPGAVVAKDVLLRHVWNDEAETHAVETVVNRLRRRLGDTPVRITTVHKRGYSLAPA